MIRFIKNLSKNIKENLFFEERDENLEEVARPVKDLQKGDIFTIFPSDRKVYCKVEFNNKKSQTIAVLTNGEIKFYDDAVRTVSYETIKNSNYTFVKGSKNKRVQKSGFVWKNYF